MDLAGLHLKKGVDMGLLDFSGKGDLSMLLNGLGLLGSKYEDQASRYQKGLMGAIQNKDARARQAQQDAMQKQLFDMKIDKANQQKASQQQFADLVGQKGGQHEYDMFPGEQPIPGLQDAPQGFLGGEYDADELMARSLQIPGMQQPAMEWMAKRADAKASSDAGATDLQFKLRKEYNDQSKEFINQTKAYNRIIKSAEDPSAAGDLALIFNYMKVLDPGSTVREGEFANAQNAGGIDSKLRSMYNSIIDGTRLDHPQRADFVKRAGMLYQGALDGQSMVDNRYKSLAEVSGVDPQNVLFNPGIGIYEYPKELLEQKPSVETGRLSEVIGGVTYYSDDGGETWYE